jgi:hypothetical protein
MRGWGRQALDVQFAARDLQKGGPRSRGQVAGFGQQPGNLQRRAPLAGFELAQGGDRAADPLRQLLLRQGQRLAPLLQPVSKVQRRFHGHLRTKRAHKGR